MANTRFQHKRSTVSGVTPTTSDIAAGELGLNLADRRLFTSNGSAVFELGSNLASLSVSGNAVITGSANAANVTAALFTGNLTGTASNSTNLNSQPGSFYTNASNITTGTLPMAQLGSNVVNTTAAFTISGLHTHTANVHMGNSTVNTQHSNATILISNSTSTTTLGLTDLRIGNTTTNVVISNTVSTFGANVVVTGAATLNGNTAANNWLDVRSYVENESAPTISGGVLTLDFANSMIFDVSLNSNITTWFLANVPSTASKAVSFVLVFTADGTARTVAWPASFRWSNGNTAPTITSTLNKRDVFTFLSTDNGTSWNAFITGQNI